jgi:hypothetical protein
VDTLGRVIHRGQWRTCRAGDRRPAVCSRAGPEFFVGIDWATEIHAVCVQDTNGRRVAAFPVEHTADGLAALMRWLARIGEPGSMPVGIERPDGRLVDALLEAGHPVVPVKPNAIKTWRDGEVLSGAKSDAGDAEVIAEYLRLRHHRLQLATPYTSETKALRTVTRTRGDLGGLRVATTNHGAWTTHTPSGSWHGRGSASSRDAGTTKTPTTPTGTATQYGSANPDKPNWLPPEVDTGSVIGPASRSTTRPRPR